MELFFTISLTIVIHNIVYAYDAVSAALFLILLAITLSMFLFYFNVNFLAILYLAVYIGAVAVFFLFVVMMTDLNSVESVNPYSRLLGFWFPMFFSIFVSFLVTYLLVSFKGAVKLSIDSFNSNIESIGLCMFNEHSGPFILAALVILIALIGSIFITFNSANSFNIFVNEANRSQDMEVQLSRNIATSVNLSFY